MQNQSPTICPDLRAEACRMLEDRDWFYYRELSEKAQEHALERYARNTDFPDWDYGVKEDLNDMLLDAGFTQHDLYYTGFCSQGDGACVTGHYSYSRGVAKKYVAEWPQDTELHAILRELQDVQRRSFYQLRAGLTHRGRYYHSRSVDITVTDNYDRTVSVDAETALISVLRELMDYCYKRLRDKYDYVTSEGARADLLDEAADYRHYNVEGALL